MLLYKWLHSWSQLATHAFTNPQTSENHNHLTIKMFMVKCAQLDKGVNFFTDNKVTTNIQQISHPFDFVVLLSEM